MDEDGSIYFIEMNARIQVEHPVTEMVTGVDLIKSQIRLATGEKLDDVVGKLVLHGHAIECRINAEDPETFVPSAGHITVFRTPGGPGIRVDTAAHADAVIPPVLRFAGGKAHCLWRHARGGHCRGCGGPWKCSWSKASRHPSLCSAKS